MQNENTSDASDRNNNAGNVIDRKKRVKRMKTVILIIVIILLILPTVCCIILGLQVYRLQLQVNELSAIHSKYGLAYNHKDENYAYAAEKEKEESYSSGGLPSVSANLPDTSGQISEQANQIPDRSNQVNTGTGELKDASGLLGKLLPEQKGKSTLKSKKDLDNSKKEDSSSHKTGKYSKKKVYLTFDDGPSIYTDDILDILSEYKVKATFFVIGQTDDWSKEMYQRIIKDGHTLGMHSYSHIYSQIYNSVEDFDKDFTKLWKLLYDTTGYKPSIYRFPGGSINSKNENTRNDIINYLNKAGMVYFDWNVVNGDATGVEYKKQQLINNVLDSMENKENCVVLMHDSQTKKTTVDSLPGLLDALQSEGAQILPLSKDVTPIHMILDDKVK